MVDDTLGFLDAPTEQPAEAAPAVVVETPAEGATPEAPKVETPATPEVSEGKNVPLPTFLDMRDRAIAAEKRLKEVEPPRGFQPPDPTSDPAGYLQYERNMVGLTILNERMNTSERFASKEYGKEFVEKAREWATKRFAEDSAYEDRIMAETDPYEVVIRDYKKAQLLEEMSDEEEVKAYREWKKSRGQQGATEGQAIPTTQPSAQAAAPKIAAQPQPAVPKPEAPKSIAGVPSSGGAHVIPVGSGQAFDGLFQRE